MKFLSLLSLWITSFVVFATESPLKLVKDDVVVFLGGTDMVRAQRSGYLETLLTWRYSEQTPKFRDMSWEADTAVSYTHLTLPTKA